MEGIPPMTYHEVIESKILKQETTWGIFNQEVGWSQSNGNIKIYADFSEDMSCRLAKEAILTKAFSRQE